MRFKGLSHGLGRVYGEMALVDKPGWWAGGLAFEGKDGEAPKHESTQHEARCTSDRQNASFCCLQNGARIANDWMRIVR
jgi:hypothetical protein